MSSRDHATDGFTLIEMLVVIVIIMVVSTTSAVFFLRFMQSSGLRESGRLFTSAFNRTSRLASTKRINHFLVFIDETEERGPILHIVEDLNQNGILDDYNATESGNPDRQVDHIQFSDFLKFQLNGDKGTPPLFTSKTKNHFFIQFGPTGAITGSSKQTSERTHVRQLNRTWRDSPEPPEESGGTYDFYIKREPVGKLFLDWEPSVGRVMDQYYTDTPS